MAPKNVAPKPVDELPKIEGRGGRVREENPFDDYVLLSYENAQPYFYTTAQLKSLGFDEPKSARSKVVASATYQGVGVDIRINDDGLWFAARERRERTAKTD